MVQFIRKEAEEKANEIRAAAQEEYTIQKQTMVEAEKAKIRKEYERKRSQIDTKKAMYVTSHHVAVFLFKSLFSYLFLDPLLTHKCLLLFFFLLSSFFMT